MQKNKNKTRTKAKNNNFIVLQQILCVVFEMYNIGLWTRAAWLEFVSCVNTFLLFDTYW